MGAGSDSAGLELKVASGLGAGSDTAGLELNVVSVWGRVQTVLG